MYRYVIYIYKKAQASASTRFASVYGSSIPGPFDEVGIYMYTYIYLIDRYRYEYIHICYIYIYKKAQASVSTRSASVYGSSVSRTYDEVGI